MRTEELGQQPVPTRVRGQTGQRTARADADVATWDEVRAAALGLPGVVEHPGPRPSWRIRGKPLAWERPLRRADLDALGDAAPTGPILGIRTVDLPAREELLAALPQVF